MRILAYGRNFEFRIADFELNKIGLKVGFGIAGCGFADVNREELEKRTKEFAIRVIRFVTGLPRGKVADRLGTQLLNSGTSIGANYREANRAQSRSDFIHKIALAEKEAAETQYWIELLEETNIGHLEERNCLLEESNALLAILAKIGKTAKSRRV